MCPATGARAKSCGPWCGLVAANRSLRNRAGTRSLAEQGRQAELERFTPHAEERPSGPSQLFAKRSTGDLVRARSIFFTSRKIMGKKSKLASSSNGMRFAHLRIHGCGYGMWLEPESVAGPLAVVCARQEHSMAGRRAPGQRARSRSAIVESTCVFGQASVSDRWNHRGLGRPERCRVKGLHDALRSIWGGA